MAQTATSRDSFRDLGRDRGGKRACRNRGTRDPPGDADCTMPIRRELLLPCRRECSRCVFRTPNYSTSKMIILRKVLR